MSEPGDVQCSVSRYEFLKTARALVRAWPKRLLGEITIKLEGGHLRIESEWGGCVIPVSSHAGATAQVSATAFSKLIASYGHVREPEGLMPVVFRPQFKEIAIDRAGVNARAVTIE